MNRDAVRILLVEDNPHDVRLLRAHLAETGMDAHVTCETKLSDALYRLERGGIDVILLDLSLPDARGLSTIEHVVSVTNGVPIVVLTGLDDRELSFEAVKRGAQDYLVKTEVESGLLERSIRYAIERSATQRALKQSEERYALAVRGTSDGLWDWDVKDARVHYSERWCSMIGLEPEDVGDSIDEWLQRVHPKDRDALLAAIDAHVSGASPSLRAEYRMLTSKGTYRWMLVRATALRDESGWARRVVGAQTDVTAARVRDPLTDLPNRALFEDRVEGAMRRSRRAPEHRCAVLVVNLDRFRMVNESYGHGAGDEVLIEVARRLRRCVRAGDTVARISGDTFHILLEELQRPEIASRAAARIQTALSDALRVNAGEVYLSATAGLAYNDNRYSEASELIRDAEIAAHRAKAMGKGGFEVFDPKMQADARRSVELESDLRRALQRDELTVVHQPIFDLLSRRVLGFEALLRWDHPTHGRISPVDFIPVAEDSGLIIEVGRWVLNRACLQLATWNDNYAHRGPLSINVNVSPSQFVHRALVDDVNRALRDTRLSGKLLKLELTESSLVSQPEAALASMRSLAQSNVRIALDDFGTGYSSLNYLHRFPFDVVKLDKSFVDTIDTDSRSQQVVGGIIALCHRLGIEVVAEGLETEAQLKALMSLGCRAAQGFLLAKPLTVSECEALLNE